MQSFTLADPIFTILSQNAFGVETWELKLVMACEYHILDTQHPVANGICWSRMIYHDVKLGSLTGVMYFSRYSYVMSHIFATPQWESLQYFVDGSPKPPSRLLADDHLGLWRWISIRGRRHGIYLARNAGRRSDAETETYFLGKKMRWNATINCFISLVLWVVFSIL